MNKKITISIILAISLFLVAPLARAEPPSITMWTDKTQYAPGESGTLYFTFKNNENSAITIEKITIVFEEWHVYRNGKWEGNQTLVLNTPVAANGYYQNQTTFTVPTDGRAVTTSVEITFDTAEIGNVHSNGFVMVYQTPRDMEQIITLFTILVVLVIVCTIIIAATIFLSARRPQVMWREEEKGQ